MANLPRLLKAISIMLKHWGKIDYKSSVAKKTDRGFSPKCKMDKLGYIPTCPSGARDWNRTSTSLRTADFESAASTNSATRALQLAAFTTGRQYYGFPVSCPKCAANIFSRNNTLLPAAALPR